MRVAAESTRLSLSLSLSLSLRSQFARDAVSEILTPTFDERGAKRPARISGRARTRPFEGDSARGTGEPAPLRR